MADKAKTSRENGRKGGRPKGSKSAATLEKERVLEALRARAMKASDKIFNAHMIATEGTHKMIRIVKEAGIPKTEVIRDEKLMDKMFETGVYGKDYFIVVGTPGDWRAGNALWDRTFGRPKEHVEITGEEGGPIEHSIRQLPDDELERIAGGSKKGTRKA